MTEQELRDKISTLVDRAMYQAAKPGAFYHPKYWDFWRDDTTNEIIQLFDLDRPAERPDYLEGLT